MRGFRFAIVLFVLLDSIPISWAQSVEATIAGRSVSVSLVKAEDLSPAPWPDDNSQLTTDTVVARANTNIYDLLTANCIEPDVEAFTLVYDLNPSLVQIDPLPSGVNLVLPKMTAGDALQDKIRHGYLVLLTVDGALREEIAKNTSDLQQLTGGFTNLGAEQFTSPSVRDAMVSDLKALAGWFAYVKKTFLQRTGPPLRRQTLLGMRDELVALNSLLRASVGGQKVTADEQEQVDAIYKDIQVQIRKYDNVMAGEPPASDGRYRVIVTIHGGNAERLRQLQVYYTWEGLFSKQLGVKPFDDVGSGSSADLTIADYVIWAGEPGHPFPPVTDQKPISIGPAGDNPRQIGLSVTK